jgi:hypothetical protein
LLDACDEGAESLLQTGKAAEKLLVGYFVLCDKPTGDEIGQNEPSTLVKVTRTAELDTYSWFFVAFTLQMRHASVSSVSAYNKVSISLLSTRVAALPLYNSPAETLIFQCSICRLLDVLSETRRALEVRLELRLILQRSYTD